MLQAQAPGGHILEIPDPTRLCELREQRRLRVEFGRPPIGARGDEPYGDLDTSRPLQNHALALGVGEEDSARLRDRLPFGHTAARELEHDAVEAALLSVVTDADV